MQIDFIYGLAYNNVKVRYVETTFVAVVYGHRCGRMGTDADQYGW